MEQQSDLDKRFQNIFVTLIDAQYAEEIKTKEERALLFCKLFMEEIKTMQPEELVPYLEECFSYFPYERKIRTKFAFPITPDPNNVDDSKPDLFQSVDK
ncbi:hypothetical protein [Paenibacillus sp. ACRRY]|uniref:hypothetical protein n=1 Tax=Paenibacillus sp. ACRRY TaxID=2918208 RepID=UPI001EF6908D|nr:hypothetical protein [Paenibacillus sp. ACRRY]MCG7385055.1 hypothetical protein [Paenibacillus sp. ACRRY]